MKSLLCLSLLSAVLSAASDNLCAPIQAALRSQSVACRCYNDGLVGRETEAEDGESMTWVGCTQYSYTEVTAALSALPPNTTLNKLWIWDSLLPIIPAGFFDRVRPKHLILETSLIKVFDKGALVPLGPRLRSLELKNNILKKVDAQLFANLSALRHLDLGGNDIVSVDPVFAGLPQLRSLSLSNNKISHIGENALSALKGLTKLSLAGNRLTKISRQDFQGLESLEHLNLAGNLISEVEDGAFDSLKALKTLNLERNLLSHLSIQNLALLEKLQLNNNTFFSLRNLSLRRLPLLQVLSLDRNHIREVGGNAFAGLRNLRSLSLSVNSIQSLSVDSFSDLSLLNSLSLQNNRLHTLPDKLFVPLGGLERVYLAGNGLEELGERIFYGLSSLRVLSLSRNRIASIHRRSFAFPRQLERLHLAHNRLPFLHPSTLQFLPRLRLIDLSNNSWLCNCGLKWLSEWLRVHSDAVLNEESTVCASAASLPLSEYFETEAAAGCPPEGGSTLQAAEGTSVWVTTVGVVLAVVSVLVLTAVVLLYVQDGRLRKGGGIRKEPLGCLSGFPRTGSGYNLRRVPSDMVTLIPKCTTVVEKKVRFDLCAS